MIQNLTEQEIVEISLIENIQRENLKQSEMSETQDTTTQGNLKWMQESSLKSWWKATENNLPERGGLKQYRYGRKFDWTRKVGTRKGAEKS